MIHRTLYLLAAVVSLATAPAMAQEPAAQASRAQLAPAKGAGPRLDPGFETYQPKLVPEQQSLTAAAAADRTVITISTLGLVLLIVLLIVLLA